MAVGPLAQIHVSVTDLDRSITFYRDVLGIPLLFRVPDQPVAFLASGDVRLYLGVPEEPAFPSRCTLYFRVNDIELEYERLLAAGVSFESGPHVVHRDGATSVWLAFCADPDGHNLALLEERRRSSP